MCTFIATSPLVCVRCIDRKNLFPLHGRTELSGKASFAVSRSLLLMMIPTPRPLVLGICKLSKRNTPISLLIYIGIMCVQERKEEAADSHLPSKELWIAAVPTTSKQDEN